MAVRKPRCVGKDEDGGSAVALGIVALGSLVGNIYQASRLAGSKADYRQLRISAENLKDQYEDLLYRYENVAVQYQSLRQTCEGYRDVIRQLDSDNKRLNEVLKQVRTKIADLEIQLRDRTTGSWKRNRRVRIIRRAGKKKRIHASSKSDSE